MDVVDPSGTENSEQTFIWREDFALNSGNARSYRCAFCKRGFSNAQALGGHMNIHRRDRAKLREFSGENLLSLDITKYANCEESSAVDSLLVSSEKLSFESSTAGANEKFLDDKGAEEDKHDVVRVVKESSLPLFAEVTSVKGERVEAAVGGGLEKHAEIHGELDLELRLGPEPKSKQ